MSIWELFRLFFKLGCTFGSGTAMTALLQDELVRNRKELTRSEFMGVYGLARIGPSGSTTALAVAFGHRYCGVPGTIVALVAMILPGFLITVLLTVGREQLRGTPFFPLLNLTLMPAALALVIVSTWKLAEEFFHPSVELLLAIAAAIAILLFRISPPILLVAGGLVGAFTIRERSARAKRAEESEQSGETQRSGQSA
jgi:chromate transporter